MHRCMGTSRRAHSTQAGRPCKRCAADHALRFFRCTICSTLAAVCRGCDRGQRYCSQACRLPERAKQVRQAGCRYQAREHGRQQHAARQRAYQARKRMEAVAVARQQPHPLAPDRLAVIAPNRTSSQVAKQLPSLAAPQRPSRPSGADLVHVCLGCGQSSGGWLRRFFLFGRKRHRHR